MLDSKFMCTLQLSPLCSLRFDRSSPLSFSSIICGNALLRKDAMRCRSYACNVPSSVPSSDCSVGSDSATSCTAAPRRLCPWDSPGKNTGVGAISCSPSSACSSPGLECGLSSIGAGAQLLRGKWGPPGPGIEPLSPALAGGFFTTEPPGSPQNNHQHLTLFRKCYLIKLERNLNQSSISQ